MDIEPKVLVFEEPLGEVQSVPLHLTNKTSGPLVYKVKTTSPKTYCVRPNASLVNPGETIEVAITRQAHEAHEPSKDKFLIMSAKFDGVEPDTKPDMAHVWSKLESGDKSAIDSTRIKVRFNFDEPPRSGSSGSAGISGASVAGVAGVTGATAAVAGSTGGASSASNVSSGSGSLKEAVRTPSAAEKASSGVPTHFAGITGVSEGITAPDHGNHTMDKAAVMDSTLHSGDDSLVADYTAQSIVTDNTIGNAGKSAIPPPSGPPPSAPSSEPSVLSEVGAEDLSKLPGVPAKSDLVSHGDAKTGPVLSRNGSSYPSTTGPLGSSGLTENHKHSDSKEKADDDSKFSSHKEPEESESLEAGVAAAAFGAVAALGAKAEGGVKLDDTPKDKAEKQHVSGEHAGGKQSVNAGGKQTEHVGGKQSQNAGAKQSENIGGKQSNLPHVGGKQSPVDLANTGAKQEGSTGVEKTSDVTKRTTGSTTSHSASSPSVHTMTQADVPVGVPLPVVAAIALIAFLLGWKLF